MKAFEVWKFVDNNLRRRVAVMVLYVLESKGSSPGRQGFCMAVNKEGKLTGSIGGGIMEYKLVELAKEMLQQDEPVITLRRQVHNKEAIKNQSGMICSGEQLVLLYRVRKADAVHVNNIIQHSPGTLSLSPKGIFFSVENAMQPDFSFIYKNDDDWHYQEKTGYKNHLYVIGSGHCSLALSKIMCMMDFYIHLYDDRGDLNTFEANTYVHEKKIISSYEELSGIIPEGNNIYVVVMTVGYRTDDIVIQALHSKQFKYFGVMASANKIQKMLSDYKANGLNEPWLKKMHSPIGLAIKSQTPEEIGISIAAQIIEEKNK